MTKSMSAALRSDFSFSQFSAAVSITTAEIDLVEQWQFALEDLGLLAPVTELRAHLEAAPRGVPQEDLDLLSDVIEQRGRPGGLAAPILS